MLSKGHMTLGHFRGVPIRIHWSAPLGALLLGRFEFVPGFWAGFLLLVLIHELGHAYLVHRRKLRALEVMVYAFGGYCRHESGSEYDNTIIAWGGVLAQALVILLPTYVLIALGLWPRGVHWSQLAYAFVHINLAMIAFNLIPMPPLDGAKAWQVFGLWNRRRKYARSRQQTKAWQPPMAEMSPEEQARRIAEDALAQARDDLRRR